MVPAGVVSLVSAPNVIDGTGVDGVHNLPPPVKTVDADINFLQPFIQCTSDILTFPISFNYIVGKCDAAPFLTCAPPR